jgi:hypothetical protein
MKKYMLAALLCWSSIPAFAVQPSVVCPAVETKANQALGRVLAIEARDPNPDHTQWDQMDNAARRQKLSEAEGLETAMGDLITKVTWMVNNGCMKPETLPNWQNYLADANTKLQQYHAYAWGFHKLLGDVR